MRNDDQISKLDVQRRGSIGVHGLKPMKGCFLEKVTPEQQREIFRKALEEQKKREAAAAAAPAKGNTAAAVHDDRLYRGFNQALRCYVRGRTHEREILKARGFRHAI